MYNVTYYSNKTIRGKKIIYHAFPYQMSLSDISQFCVAVVFAATLLLNSQLPFTAPSVPQCHHLHATMGIKENISFQRGWLPVCIALFLPAYSIPARCFRTLARDLFAFMKQILNLNTHCAFVSGRQKKGGSISILT